MCVEHEIENREESHASRDTPFTKNCLVMNIYPNIDNSTRAFVHNAFDEKLGIFFHIEYLQDLSTIHIYIILQMHVKVGYFKYMRVRAHFYIYYIKYEMCSPF